MEYKDLNLPRLGGFRSIRLLFIINDTLLQPVMTLMTSERVM